MFGSKVLDPRAPRIVREVLCWIPVGAIPIVDGLVRIAVLREALGEKGSGWASAALDVVAIVLYARAIAPSDSAVMRGLRWGVMSALLHFALGRAFGLSLSASVAKYDIASGEPWLVVSLAVVAAPIVADWSRRRARRGRAQLVVLVGPKGVGKSTLGRALGEAKGRHFVEVEAIARRVLASSGGVIDEGYARRAFAAIRRELRRQEHAHQILVIESTGASDEAPRFMRSLSLRYELVFVKMVAPLDACLERIRGRDPSSHVSVPYEMVRQMFARTEALDWRWDLSIDSGRGSVPQLVSAVEPFLRRRGR